VVTVELEQEHEPEVTIVMDQDQLWEGPPAPGAAAAGGCTGSAGSADAAAQQQPGGSQHGATWGDAHEEEELYASGASDAESGDERASWDAASYATAAGRSEGGRSGSVGRCSAHTSPRDW
jgi:hypothetical protein